jgi:Rv0078B-related antitoxin
MSFGDTSREAERIQLEILGRMSEGQRLRLALEMSQATRETVLSRIRVENPDWTDWEVKRELLRIHLSPSPSSRGSAVIADEVLRLFVSALEAQWQSVRAASGTG